jgi:hypothetical protein
MTFPFQTLPPLPDEPPFTDPSDLRAHRFFQAICVACGKGKPTIAGNPAMPNDLCVCANCYHPPKGTPKPHAQTMTMREVCD